MIGPIIAWVLSNGAVVVGGIVTLALALATFFIRQSGENAEKRKQQDRDTAAAQQIGMQRDKARAATDADIAKGVQKWTKP